MGLILVVLVKTKPITPMHTGAAYWPALAMSLAGTISK